MLHIETGASALAEPCPCCGRERRASFGFAHEGEDTVAFYHAALEPKEHEDRSVVLVVSLGDWGHEVDPSTRCAAVICAKLVDGEIELSFLEASESPLQDNATLGNILAREEAIASTSRDRFVEVAGAALLEDPDINDHFAH